MRPAGSTMPRKRREWIEYVPNYKTTGDLEAATRTISANAEATGLVNADYNAVLTLSLPPADARLQIMRKAARLSLTIDSDDGAHDLRCRVYVDQQDADHLFIDASFTAIGAQIATGNAGAAILPILFNALKAGGDHRFYFFLWSPGGHSPVVSAVTLEEAVGMNGSGVAVAIFQISHVGNFMVNGYSDKRGTGSMTWKLAVAPGKWEGYEYAGASVIPTFHAMSGFSVGTMEIRMYGTVATDLLYFRNLSALLESD